MNLFRDDRITSKGGAFAILPSFFLQTGLSSGERLIALTPEPLKAIINYFDLQNSAISGTAMSDPETGYYQITLPAGRLYGFLASSEKFISVNENIDLKELGEYKEEQVSNHCRSSFLRQHKVGFVVAKRNRQRTP